MDTPSFHSEILRIQRRMRWLRVNTPFRFDAVTTNLFPTIAACEGNTATELGEFLRMGAIQISRVLSRLEAQGLVRRVRVAGDARFKRVMVTAFGTRSLTEISQYGFDIARRGLAVLSSAEIGELAGFYSSTADALSAPNESSFPGEHPFVTQQRRVSRALGMLGANYAESGIDIGVYQLLYIVFSADGPIRFRNLRDQLFFEPSVLSREIDRLVEEGILFKKEGLDDGRSLHVELTNEGKDYFRTLHNRSSAFVGRALATLGPERCERFFALLQKANSAPLASPETRVRIVSCKSESDYYRARAHVVEWLVATNRHLHLPSILLPAGSSTFLVQREDQVLGVVTLEPKAREATVTGLELPPQSEYPSEELVAMFDGICHVGGYVKLRFPLHEHRFYGSLLRTVCVAKGKHLDYAVSVRQAASAA